MKPIGRLKYLGYAFLFGTTERGIDRAMDRAAEPVTVHVLLGLFAVALFLFYFPVAARDRDASGRRDIGILTVMCFLGIGLSLAGGVVSNVAESGAWGAASVMLSGAGVLSMFLSHLVLLFYAGETYRAAKPARTAPRESQRERREPVLACNE